MWISYTHYTTTLSLCFFFENISYGDAPDRSHTYQAGDELWISFLQLVNHLEDVDLIVPIQHFQGVGSGDEEPGQQKTGSMKHWKCARTV